MERAAAVFRALMGLGIAGVWTLDLLRNPKIDLSRGVFAARNDEGSLFWPHWLAEYGTAAALLAGAGGLLAQAGWGRPLGLVALGALVYTSTNSLGWSLAAPERRPYAVPMIVGLLGGVGFVGALLAA